MDMADKRAARGCSINRRAKVSRRDTDILQENWERGTFWAGMLVASSFGGMLALGAWLGW